MCVNQLKYLCGAGLLVSYLTAGCRSSDPSTTSTPPPADAPVTAKSTPNVPDELTEGAPAPKVILPLQDGTQIDLSKDTEKAIFVYFYPKDDTPGCTIEAKGLRDNYQALTQAGVQVIGVSVQDAESHQQFISKYELPFSLAVDNAGDIAKAFDVPLYGGLTARQSFLIKSGKVVKIWRDVVPNEHAQEVLLAAQSL